MSIPQAVGTPANPQASWPAPLVQVPQEGILPVQYQQSAPMMAGPQGAPYYGPGNELNPYPGLDMYRYGHQQHINQNGLWFSEKLNAQRKYHFGVEMMVPVYGAPGNQMFGYSGLNTGIAATHGVPPAYFSSPRPVGDIVVGGGGGGGGNNANIVDPSLLTRYFPTRDFKDMFNDNSSIGIRLNMGFENENGSGVSINAWHGGRGSEIYQQGAPATRNYTPSLDPFDLIGNDPLYILQLSAMNGSLPINSGSGVAERIPFDTMFQMKFSQEAWGAGLHIIRPAIVQGNGYRVQPVLGLRYIDIREGFGFRGIDSGAEYEVINFNDIDYVQEFETLFNLDLGYVSTGGNTTAVGDAGFEGRPDVTTFNDDAITVNPSSAYPLVFFPTNPYETRINASNHIRAAGPEVGFRTELGDGDNLKVTFLTTAGITATSEAMKLNGYGVYNHFVNRVDPDNNPLTPDGGSIGTGLGGLTDAETTFEDSVNTSHVSPIIDLSVNVEFRLFEHIPLLKRSSLLEKAKFNTSYGWLYVGNVSRPYESVRYDSFPVNPSLAPKRSGWTMQQWTFGLDWQY